MLSKYIQWFNENILLLENLFGSDRIDWDISDYQWITIEDYPLPPNWRPTNSKFLMRLPLIKHIFTIPPDHFYLETGLRNINGIKPNHYIEKGDFNDLEIHGIARYSFHIRHGWRPTLPCRQGTNLIDVLDQLHESMTNAAKE